MQSTHVTTPSRRAFIAALTVTCAALGAMPAPARAQHYHNPRGSFVLRPELALGFSEERTVVGLGAGFGYAVLTGVLPGLRGMVLIDDGELGGELGLTLTLTPPLDFYLVPYGYGELGRRWDSYGGAWMYAGGGGVFLGEPASPLGVQVGWIFRRFVYADFELDGSGPMIALSIRF